MPAESPKRVHLDKEGLETFFGELEAKIMKRLWEQQPCSILCVKQGLEKERDYNYNTVMTVLNRLVEKGMVRKKKKGKTTYYTPAQKKDEFMKSAARAMLKTFLGRKAVFSAAHFAEALGEFSKEDLEELKKALK